MTETQACTPITVADLPDDLPIFPLEGVLLLPRGQLPLNIFEPRYLAMVEDAMKGQRLIGMIQPRGATTVLYDAGCAGKIVSYAETDDGRYLITLKGVCRFHVLSELQQGRNGYRRVKPDWAEFAKDVESVGKLNIDRARLKGLLKTYFDIEGMECSWKAVDDASDDNLITCLSMICPLNVSEKQALLEARCGKTRADLFMTLLDMATRDSSRARPEGSILH